MAIATGTALAIAALTGAGGSIAGAKMGSDAANRSARMQTDATNRAAELQAQATRDALAFQREQFEYGQQTMAPYLRIGEQSLGTLGNMMGFPGGAGGGTGAPMMAGRAGTGGAPGTLGNMGGYQPPEMVLMASPDGSSTRQVPRAMVPHYTSRGGRVVG
jgi:hypothetical protein